MPRRNRRPSREQADEQEARLAAIINSSVDAIVSTDIEGRVTSWNPGAERLYGYSATEMLGRPITIVVPEELRDEHSPRRERIMRGEYVGRYETERITKDGRRIAVALSLAPILNHAGRVIGVNGIARDITAIRHADAELRLSEQRFRLALNAIPDAFVIYDRDLKLRFVNSKAAQLAGRSIEAMIGRCDAELFAQEMTDQYLPVLRHARDSRSVRAIECSLQTDGATRTLVMTYVPMLDEGGEILQILGIAHDITASKQAEQRLLMMAQYDALTGLPNRTLYTDRLAHAIARARRFSTLLGVMILDLDRFKEINDTHGHATGDQLLKHVADRLRSGLRHSDTVARLGGDEFTVLVEDVSTRGEITRVADKIKDAFVAPFILPVGEVFITPSIGITVFPGDGEDLNTLLANADIAMYQAKKERNSYQHYRSEMNANTAARLGMESQLRRALERDEFALHYQPQIEIDSGRIIGVEALLRWRNRDLGEVPTPEFIQLAEDTGLIVPIGEWILRTACAQCRAWQAAQLPGVTMSVNIAAQQFRRGNLLRVVEDALATSGLDARWLAIEITESSIMERAVQAVNTLQALSGMGVSLALDDFGTGYSSLSYLKRFPVDRLKIDQSFVRDIGVDPGDAAIVSAIVAISKSLALKTIAEGVETSEQLVFLRNLRCDEFQGYYFSRPLVADDVAALLRSCADTASSRHAAPAAKR